MLDGARAPRRRPKPSPPPKRRRVPQSPGDALRRRSDTSPWSESKGGAADAVSIDFEDRTEMERTTHARPAPGDRVPSDRADTETDGSTGQPWEDVIDAATGPGRERWPERPTRPTAPSDARPGPSAPSGGRRPPARSLPEMDTEERVIQAMPKRAAPEKKVSPHDLPTFGIDVDSWPSGNTKPVFPAHPSGEDSGLLENKPVTGAGPPPARPGDRPPNEETRLGAMVTPDPIPNETVAAPGELAGLMNGGRSRPELVDDLLSNGPKQSRTPAFRDDDESIDRTRPVEGLFRDNRELDRAQMQQPVDQTSPDSLRDLQIPSKPTEPDQAPGAKPPLEETRAFVEMPLAPDRPDSVLLPMAGSPEDTSELPSPEVSPRGPTAGVMKLELASGTRRALALLIDGVVVLAVVAVPLLLGLFGDAPATADWIEPDDVGTMLIQGDLTIPLVCLVVLILVFSALSHGLTGRSFGKLICGLEVVRKKTGDRITMGRSVARAFLTLLSLMLGGAGYLWLIVDRRARTFHDYLTGTIVVRSSSRPVS